MACEQALHLGERASGEGRGGEGRGRGRGGEKNRPLLSLPASRCRVSSHVPLARILFAISPNGKLACMLGGVCLRRLIFLIMRAKNKKKMRIMTACLFPNLYDACEIALYFE